MALQTESLKSDNSGAGCSVLDYASFHVIYLGIAL